MIIETLIANPAAGKTDAILYHLYENKEFAVIASPSRNLSEQSYNKFKMLGGEAVIIDSSRYLPFKTVSASLIKAVRDKIRVIFITHACLANIEHAKIFKDYSLYIDEVPDLVDFKEYPFKSNLSIITEHCEPIKEVCSDMQILKLIGSHESIILEKIKNGYDGDDVVDNLLYGLYEALLDKRIHVMIKHNKGDIKNGSKVFFLNDTKKDSWDGFKKITIACSNLYDTYTGKFLIYYHNCSFVNSPLESRLRFREYKNTDRVHIHVMTDLYKWSRYKSNQNNIFRDMVNLVKKKCGNNFIYTVNKDRETHIDGYGEKIPYGAQGLNRYIHYTNVAVLFSFNPQPWKIEILKGMAKLCDIQTDEFIDARHLSDYLEPAFQLCLRCNLRDNESNKPIHLFVPDMILAEYLKSYLPDAKILTDDMIKTQDRQNRKYRKDFPKIFSMSKEESRRFSTFKNRQKKKGIELKTSDMHSMEIVRLWVIKQRQKQRWV